MNRRFFSVKLFLIWGLAMALGHGVQAQTLTFERVIGEPSLSGPSAGRVSFDPDGGRIVFLQPSDEDVDISDLWVADVTTGARRVLLQYRDIVQGSGVLSEAEKARRERQRIRTGGIVEYQWARDRADQLLVPVDGALYVITFTQAGEDVRQLTDETQFETDAKLSPNGAYASFIRGGAVFIQAIDADQAVPFSPAASGTVTYGMAEFVAQEEMDRDTGYWWSPDSQYIAYMMVDEAPVDVVLRPEIGASGVSVIEQRYPRAGTDNALVRLFVAPVSDPAAYVEIDLGPQRDIYVPRVSWASDSKTLLVQRQSRDQKTLDILEADTASGTTKLLWQETAKTWINLHHDLRALKTGQGYLWASERSGFKHIYLRDRSGAVVRQVTAGDWQVDAIQAIDEDAGVVLFTGRMDGTIERHLYRVSYQQPAAPQRVTQLGYWNDVKVAPDGSSFLNLRSSPAQPHQLGLFDGQGNLLRWIVENPLDQDHPYAPFIDAHVTPSYGEIELEDGTVLDYELLLPPGDAKVPAVLNVYGGPGVQIVRRDWGGLTDQVMLQHGIALMRLDNRGASGRGKAFEDPIYKNLGAVEVADQMRALDVLANHPRIDASRIAVEGWSYGGYMALKMLMKASDKLVAGVSGAPVTRWQLYDTHYTERFLGLPSGHGEMVYAAANVFGDLEGLKDPLLIIHGMADDNVLFDNSTELFAALQQQALAFETMVYPGQKHGLRGASIRQHAQETTLRFLLRHLKPD